MAVSDLLSAGLIEKDIHGDVMWTWSYPTVTRTQRTLFLSKCGLQTEQDSTTTLLPYIYSQYSRDWYYIHTTKVQSTALPKVTHISLVVIARDFNPEKYEVLTSILAKLYLRTGNPASMLESYLSVATRGSCNGEENGTFVVQEFQAQRAYATTAIRDMIARFGMEVIFLYTAMLLKRRIVLHHSNAEELLSSVRTLPAFVWHRQNWAIAYPYVFVDGPEMAALESSSHFVAGFTDASIENSPEFYDIFVNLGSNEIVVAPHAKDSFGLGKLHKELATFVVQCAEDETKSEQQIIKDIASKTKELMNNLRTLSSPNDAGKDVIQLEKLRERKMAAATENFLYNLAAAEGMAES